MIDATADGVIMDVRVIPRASKPGIAGTRGDAVLVRVSAPPVDSAANDELIELLASALHVPRRAVAVVQGQRARTKRVAVSGLDHATATRRLRTLVASSSEGAPASP